MSGTLYLVATPIGNLQDMSYRAVEILKNVDTILCEDTKHSLILLNHYEIKNKLISYHKFNEKAKYQKIIEMLDDGKNIALITDAGMPLISDPGFVLVDELRKRGNSVKVIPGACACVSALVVSGLNTVNFYFFGFLKGNNSDKVDALSQIKGLKSTLIFYLSPHSFLEDVEILKKVLGNRRAVAVNELTKMYEKEIDFNLCDEITFDIKGEYVLVVEGDNSQNNLNTLSVEEHIAYYTNMGIDKKNALKMVAKDRGVSKSVIYKQSFSQK